MLADRLLDDLLLLERPPDGWGWPSSTIGDTGLFALVCLLEVPLSRALLEGGVSIVVMPTSSCLKPGAACLARKRRHTRRTTSVSTDRLPDGGSHWYKKGRYEDRNLHAGKEVRHGNRCPSPGPLSKMCGSFGVRFCLRAEVLFVLCFSQWFHRWSVCRADGKQIRPKKQTKL